MTRHTRYQGAILQDHAILLIRHKHHASNREYWVLPGGGIEAGESEEACVVREMREETNLNVKVVELLIDEPGHPEGIYQRRKTYLCRPISGTPSPGHEPELEASLAYAIDAVRWFDLRAEETWGPELLQDRFTYPQLKRIRSLLGYES